MPGHRVITLGHGTVEHWLLQELDRLSGCEIEAEWTGRAVFAHPRLYQATRQVRGAVR